MATLIGGFKDRKIETRTKVEPSTVQPLGRNRMAVDTMAQVAYQSVASDLVEAGSTTSVIVATAHQARVGDVILFLSGALIREICTISQISTNEITLSQTLSSVPAIGVLFQILSPSILQTVNGAMSVTGSVNVDNSFVGINDITNIVGQQDMNNSIPVVIASDQSNVPVAINTSVNLKTQYVANTVVTQKYTVTAGVATALAAGATPITRLDVRAALTNQGLIYFGDSSIGSGKAFYLAPGDAWSFDISDLSLLYYDGDVTNDSFLSIYYEA